MLSTRTKVILQTTQLDSLKYVQYKYNPSFVVMIWQTSYFLSTGNQGFSGKGERASVVSILDSVRLKRVWVAVACLSYRENIMFIQTFLDIFQFWKVNLNVSEKVRSIRYCEMITALPLDEWSSQSSFRSVNIRKLDNTMKIHTILQVCIMWLWVSFCILQGPDGKPGLPGFPVSIMFLQSK